MNFGEAINELQLGKMLTRTEWDGGYFIFKQIPSEIKKDIVPKMQSLPQSVKDEFEKRFNHKNYKFHQIDSIYYDNQIGVVNNDNLIVSWTPTIVDIEANDWELY